MDAAQTVREPKHTDKGREAKAATSSTSRGAVERDFERMIFAEVLHLYVRAHQHRAELLEIVERLQRPAESITE
jgi:hypothetical protein